MDFRLQVRTFDALFGFLLVAETVPRFLDAHAGVHLPHVALIPVVFSDFQFKEVLEVVGHSASVCEALLFGSISSERRR